MNKDEAILKIKEQMKKLMSFSETPEAPAAPDTEEVKMETLKLKDGSELMIPDGSNLEPGVEIFKVDAEGNKTPCEDGTYELEKGQSIIVTGGKIESVSETAQPEGSEQTTSPAAPAQMESAVPADSKPAEQAPVSGDGDITKRVDDLEKQIAQILELLQGMSNAQEMAMSKIKEIADAPGAPSIKLGKTLSNVEMNSVKSELDELKELTKKYKLNANGGYSFNTSK